MDKFNANTVPEKFSQFQGSLDKLERLLEKQLEIAEKILKYEIDISNVRIGNLETYTNTYYKFLDSVAHKDSIEPDFMQVLSNLPKGPLTVEYKGSPPDNSNKANTKSNNTSNLNRDLDGEELFLGESQEELEDKLNSLAAIKALLDEIAKQSNEDQEDLFINDVRISEEISKLKTASAKKVFEAEKSFIGTRAALEYAKTQDVEERMLELRLQKRQEIDNTRLEGQETLNALLAETLTSEANLDEAGQLRASLDAAKEEDAILKELAKKRIDFITKAELEAKRRNNGILDEEAAAAIQERANAQFSLEEENLEKLRQEHAEQLVKELSELQRKQTAENLDALKNAKTFAEKQEAIRNLTRDEDGSYNANKTASAIVKAVADLAAQLETKIDSIASFKGIIDTRLQGSGNETWAGSYWDQLSKDMMSVGLVTPYFQQEKFAENIKELVGEGIAFNLKQRAFLKTIQEKIATTFSVADGTLLRLIRIQQEDSTAGRLGMESALNTFLNSMYENTEYLNSVASGVRSSLEEMESLMPGALATEVEYQVQKWMGSLYSVGMSRNAVDSIAAALGQIGAGQIEGLTGGGAGNLIIMAANDAGLSIADILTDGLDSSDTNKLLQATVNYLAEIAEASAENQVVQQQLASVFGVRASDLKAAVNLASKGSVTDISKSNLTYDMMVSQLTAMAGSMAKRTSLGEMMTNIWENGMYSLASSMANNPVSYLIYKLAKMLDSTVGGIDLPFVNVMGFGVDLNTTVSDLMRVAAVGTGVLGSLGPMISGLASSFSGRAMLNTMGIKSGSGLAITPRGAGVITAAMSNDGGGSTSGSGYVGNAASSDIKNSTIQEAEDTKKSLMVEAQEDAESNQVDELNQTVLKIYELLDDVVKGSATFRVRVDSYGLVNGGNHSGSSNFLAGPAGLAGQSAALAAKSGFVGNAPTSGINQFFSGALDVGGWL